MFNPPCAILKDLAISEILHAGEISEQEYAVLDPTAFDTSLSIPPLEPMQRWSSTPSVRMSPRCFSNLRTLEAIMNLGDDLLTTIAFLPLKKLETLRYRVVRSGAVSVFLLGLNFTTAPVMKLANFLQYGCTNLAEWIKKIPSLTLKGYTSFSALNPDSKILCADSASNLFGSRIST